MITTAIDQTELDRLRRIEEAARAVMESVAEADRDAFTCFTTVNPYRVAKLREALEAK